MHLLLFLNIGVILPVLQSLGNLSVTREQSNIIFRGSAISFQISFNTLGSNKSGH